MKFIDITIMNFLSFGAEQIVSFEQRGLVAMFGVNRDSSGADSNGAGKSAILEAVVWALFGGTIRGYKADEVINRIAKKNCRVALCLREENREYRVIRYRKLSGMKKPNDLILEINGVDKSAGTIEDTQQLVTTILGMDQQTFTQSVLLRSSDRSFSEMTDKEQKSVLEDILQIDELAKAHAVVRARVTTRQSELATVKMALFRLQEQGEQAELRLGKVRLSEGQHSTLLAQKKKALQREKVAVEAEVERRWQVTGLDVLIDTLQDFDAALEQQDEICERTRVSVERVHKENQVKRDKHSRQTGDLQAQQRHLREESQNLSQLAGRSCPTCKQAVDPNNVDGLMATWDAQLENLGCELEGMSEAFSALDAEEDQALVVLEGERQGYVSEIQRLRAGRQLIADKVRKREDALQQIIDLEQRAMTLQEDIEGLGNSVNPFTSLVGDIQSELDGIIREHRKKTYRERSLELELRHLLFWSHGFGNRGLKSFVLDNVVPFLTKRAQHYADILSSGDLQIEFSTQTQLKTGDWREQFQVKVTNRQGADVYMGNSDGEKTRIDTAVGWALGDLAATRAKKPIRFRGLDEPFENLDETGEDAVIRLLHHVLFQYETILCVTHSTHLRSQFPNEMTVTKENGFSIIN